MSLIKTASATAFAISPIPAYLPQYLALKKEEASARRLTHAPSEGGFSPLASLILLLSHILRISFFIGTKTVLSGRSASNNNLDENGNGITSSGNADRMALNENHYHGSKGEFQFFIVSLQRILNVNSNEAAAGRVDTNESANNDSPETADDDMGYELLFQSFFMIAVQLLLIAVITKLRRIRRRKMQIRGPPITAATANYRARTSSIRNICDHFWQWETTREHINFLLFYSFCIFVISWVLFRFRFGVRLIGAISVVLESSLPLPQYLRNRNRRDTAGLSLLMVLGWLVGDTLKLGYFIYDQHQHTHGGKNSSSGSIVIFIGGAMYAIVLDCAVLMQILCFYPNKQVEAFCNRVFHKFGFTPLYMHASSNSDDNISSNAFESSLDLTVISSEGEAVDHHHERWVADAEHVT